MNLNRFLTALAAASLAFSSITDARAGSQQAYLKASNPAAGDQFGQSVAVAGDTMVVGAPLEDGGATNSGAAYVFVRGAGSWVQQAYLKASNAGMDDNFGVSVAISGDTVVIGASREDSDAVGVNGDSSNDNASNSGAVYVFVRNGTNWTQQAYVKPSNTGMSDLFGAAVSVSGDTLAVGAYQEDSNATGANGDGSNNSIVDSGAAYIFVRSGTNWTQQAYLKASNRGTVDQFGRALALSSDTLVVGSPLEDSSALGVNGNQGDNTASASGAAYVFVRSGTNWTQQAYLKASNTGAGDSFGTSVAVSGDTLAVGANGEDSQATGVNGDEFSNGSLNSGAAYVFVRSGVDWTQQAYLKASVTQTNQAFGTAVSVSGNTLVIGATGEVSNAGAAYVFTRSGADWASQSRLGASNPEADDQFGISVSISGDTVVTGAFLEDSSATGVNGSQNNNGALNSGAAYVFGGQGIVPRLTIARDGGTGYFVRLNALAGRTYRWLRGPTVTGPWTTNATTMAGAAGVIEFHDLSAPPGQSYYRAVQE